MPLQTARFLSFLRSPAGHLLVFLLLLTSVLSPLLICFPLPLGDYTNHLARMHIISAIADSENLARYYRITWAAIPNLASDILVPPLGRLIGIENALLAFTAASLLLISTGAIALNRALHRARSLLPLTVFFLLYNRQFLWGFLNYLFAVGVMLWLLAAWVSIRPRLNTAWSLAFLFPTTLLFLFHLHPLAAYGVCVLGLEWSERSEHAGNRKEQFRKLALALLQFIPSGFILLFASPTSQRAGDVVFGSLANKAVGLFDAFNNYNQMLDGATTALFFLVLIWGLYSRALVLHRKLAPAIILLAILYLITPNVLFSSFGADRRSLIAILILLLAGLRAGKPLTDRATALTVFGLASLFIARMLIICMHWGAADEVYARLSKGFEPIENGQRVACLVAEPMEPFLRDPPLDHFCNLAVVMHDVFVNALFAEPGKQILSVPYNADTLFNRSESQEFRFAFGHSKAAIKGVLTALPLDRFDWVYMIHDSNFSDARPRQLELVWRDNKDDTSLYRIHHDPTPH